MKRYDPEFSCDGYEGMQPFDDGDYVLYEDVERMMAAIGHHATAGRREIDYAASQCETILGIIEEAKGE